METAKDIFFAQMVFLIILDTPVFIEFSKKCSVKIRSFAALNIVIDEFEGSLKKYY
ncbi:hypothetical protein [Kriegella aquimaris]|uniref:Uncharacterized protein n=1 Tax=Kriegella aquimaris TaxID=192904 RepID=A0A1G9VZZ9_9FLAO|nr:hypothetical protein [Kriegella aquimaris]SDM77693.1 hypothetical protein SAMN04488514_114112 [Kriegella aquimaris]